MPSDVTVRCGCGFNARVTNIDYTDRLVQIVASLLGHPDHTLDPPAPVVAAEEEHDLTAASGEPDRPGVAVGFVQPAGVTG